MISFFVASVCLGSSTTNIVERTTVDGNVWSGKLYLDTLESVATQFDFSSNTSFFPKFYATSLPVHLYTFRMNNESTIDDTSTVLANTHFIQLSPWSVPEFSIVLNLYKTDFFFLGRPPREVMVHMKGNLCQDHPVEHYDTENTTSPAYYAINVTLGGQTVGLSYSNHRHYINNKTLCRWQTMILPQSENEFDFFSVYIDCSNYIESSENVLSATLLDIGIYSSVDETCLYTPNNDELDHEFAVTLVGFLFVFLCIWIEWTRERHSSNYETPSWTEKDVWTVTTVTYAPLVYQVIILVISTSIYARSQKSHNIYNFATMRMLDKDTVDITAMIFSWVVCPFIGSLALFVMAVGKIKVESEIMKFDKSELIEFNKDKTKVFCGWGIASIENKSDTFRYIFTFFVFCVVYGVVYGLWVEGLQDWRGSLAIGVTLLPTFVHFSNPHWLSNYLSEKG